MTTSPTPTTPAPGPGLRVVRTAGQAGGAVVLIELWQAFGWFGAAGWTPDESAARWPAITASLLFVIAVVQNGVAAWQDSRAGRVEVAPVEAAPPSPEAPEPAPDTPPAPGEPTMDLTESGAGARPLAAGGAPPLRRGGRVGPG